MWAVARCEIMISLRDHGTLPVSALHLPTLPPIPLPLPLCTGGATEHNRDGGEFRRRCREAHPRLYVAVA
jgi:hypothetical protein